MTKGTLRDWAIGAFLALLLALFIAAIVYGIRKDDRESDRKAAAKQQQALVDRREAIHRIDVVCGPVIARNFRYAIGPETGSPLYYATKTIANFCKLVTP